jgi:hypothetical protein
LITPTDSIAQITEAIKNQNPSAAEIRVPPGKVLNVVMRRDTTKTSAMDHGPTASSHPILDRGAIDLTISNNVLPPRVRRHD